MFYLVDRYGTPIVARFFGTAFEARAYARRHKLGAVMVCYAG